MATLVEKLKEIVVRSYDDVSRPWLNDTIDNLIAAARAEGAEEGDWRARKRIMGSGYLLSSGAEGYERVPLQKFPGGAYVVSVDSLNPPASVLAPKETK
jgi:hypothetical protein